MRTAIRVERRDAIQMKIKAGPGEQGNSTGALAFPGGVLGTLGERRSYYRRPELPTAKGRRTGCAPFPLPPRTPGISNSDDKIAAGLGRELHQG